MPRLAAVWPYIERAAQAASLLAFAWLLILHLTMVATDAPMETRDGAMIATTVALLDGRNPYAIDGLMQTGNVYGIGYNLAVLPIAELIGPGYVAHRLVSAFAIFGACLILLRWLRIAGLGIIDSLLGTALAYAGFIYFTGAVVRPDGLGIFLMLAAVEALRRGDCDARSFAACLGLSLLGLACKLYYVWPAFAAASYVFLWRDRRRGFAYGLAAIAATAAALALMQALLPGYGPFVLVANLRDVDYDAAWLLRQIGDWALFDLPLVLALAASLLLERARIGRDFGLFGGMSLLGTLALLGILGGHTGAHLSYFFQLLTPYLVVVALAKAARHKFALGLFRLSLPVAILANAHWFPLDPVRIAKAGDDFSVARDLIRSSRESLATSEFAGILAEARRPVADTGHSAYLVNAARPPPAWLQKFVPPASAIRAEWEAEGAAIRAGVDQQRYDLALIGRQPSLLFPLDRLVERYEQAGTMTIDMPWALQRWPVILWRPRRQD
jgi:hypothetical protein